jgi:hypothetical protein
MAQLYYYRNLVSVSLKIFSLFFDLNFWLYNFCFTTKSQK